MVAPTRLLALLVLPSLALAACGQAPKDSATKFKGDQQAVAKTVEELQSAGRKRDAKKICRDVLAPALVTRIQQSSHGACDKVLKDALADADAFELQVKRVDVRGNRATAVVESSAGSKKRTDTLELERVGGSWKIATLGAAPRQG